MEDADYRVTVHIGDAHPGDIVTLNAEQLADRWMQGQIAAGNLVLVASHAGVTAPVEGSAFEDSAGSSQELLHASESE